MRIVSLLPSATDMIYDLGLFDSVVGVSQDCNWPLEVRTKPLVARNRIDLSGLSAAQIDKIVSSSKRESHSLYAVDAELLAELRPDLVITQDLCEVCSLPSPHLSPPAPLGAYVSSFTPP